jgi:hypothetical protein
MPVRRSLVVEVVPNAGTRIAATRPVRFGVTTHRIPRVERFGFHFQTFSLALVLFYLSRQAAYRPRVTGTCAYGARDTDSVPLVSARHPSR